jgi:phosphoglycolate phosphatase
MKKLWHFVTPVIECRIFRNIVMYKLVLKLYLNREGNLMNTDALIFDMDGTLWNSSDTVAACWNKVISDCPFIKEPVSAERIKSLMGMQLFKIGEELFPNIDSEKRNQLMGNCCKYENEVLRHEGGILYDGLEDTLQVLNSRTRLFIVSNCQNGYIESFFEYHKLGAYFTDYECAGTSGKSKGENIIEVIKRNNIKSAYYVGDTQIDYEATRKACIPFVYAAYGFGDVHKYEYRIDAFTDLANMF